MLKTKGIVLSEMRFKDTSKILNIYTEKLGKISVMAQGAYNPRSQIIANTQPFSYNEYQFKKGRSFYYIAQGDILKSYYSIREKMERVMYGFYMLELIEKSTEIEEENEILFLLLEKGLSVLSKLDKDFIKFITAFELKCISFLGYRPYISGCVNCESKSFNSVNFSISQGGTICGDCLYVDNRFFKMDQAMYEALNMLMYVSFDDLTDLQIEESTLTKLHGILVEYILYNIDRKEFTSLNMLNSIEC